MSKTNDQIPLANIKKNSTSDPSRDPSVIIIMMLYKLNGLSEKLALNQSRPKRMNII